MTIRIETVSDTDYLLGIIADIRQKTGVGHKPMLTELADAIAAKLTEYKKDAERFQHLLDEHSWHYGTTHDSPMECGITFGTQELSADRQGWNIVDYIDDEIALKKTEQEDLEE